jgi:DNA-binding NarL/FixJ family response regulator
LEAHEQLHIRYDMVASMGAEAFARRAERELPTTGEHARKTHYRDWRGPLLPGSAQVARLACDGLSNPEIGARLFISSRAVEYHLHRVFSKLGINSRNQLELALPRENRAAPSWSECEAAAASRLVLDAITVDEGET